MVSEYDGREGRGVACGQLKGLDVVLVHEGGLLVRLPLGRLRGHHRLLRCLLLASHLELLRQSFHLRMLNRSSQEYLFLEVLLESVDITIGGGDVHQAQAPSTHLVQHRP